MQVIWYGLHLEIFRSYQPVAEVVHFLLCSIAAPLPPWYTRQYIYGGRIYPYFLRRPHWGCLLWASRPLLGTSTTHTMGIMLPTLGALIILPPKGKACISDTKYLREPHVGVPTIIRPTSAAILLVVLYLLHKLVSEQNWVLEKPLRVGTLRRLLLSAWWRKKN